MVRIDGRRNHIGFAIMVRIGRRLVRRRFGRGRIGGWGRIGCFVVGPRRVEGGKQTHQGKDNSDGVPAHRVQRNQHCGHDSASDVTDAAACGHRLVKNMNATAGNLKSGIV